MTRRSAARPSRTSRFGSWLALGWSVALMGACDMQPEETPRVPAPASTRVLTEHRPLAADSPPSKSAGEDCTTHGRAECLSGLCLHVKPQPGTGYFCSQPCRGLEECPEGWRCARLMPGGSEHGVCQPPPGWASAVAQPRTPSLQNKPTSP
jgi:hypothetical protein